MKFGICVGPDQAAVVKAAGWDYVEGNVQSLFQGRLPDAEWTAAEAIGTAALPLPAANCLVPGDLKITGPAVDADALRSYMTRVLERAGKVGCTTLVFGSGGARNVPDGFERETAQRQIVEFLKMSAPVAQANGVTLVIEPLNRKECNIINSVKEAMEYVRAADQPAVQCLVDSYHFWLEDEPLENLEAAMPSIRHVHLADKEGRLAPGLSGTADYEPFFRVLKRGGYRGLVSFEGTAMTDFATTAPRVLAYVKDVWNRA